MSGVPERISSWRRTSLMIGGRGASPLSDDSVIRPFQVRLIILFHFILLIFVTSETYARPVDRPGNLIASAGWLMDDTGGLSLEDVKSGAFSPFRHVLSLGYGKGVVWVKLRINPAPAAALAEPANGLVLRIRPIYLDEVRIYDALAGEAPIILGDQIHPRFDQLETLDLAALLPASQTARDIFLRIESTSTRSIYAEVLTRGEFEERTQGQTIVLSVLLAITLFFFMFGLAHWLISHDRLMGIFAVKQATSFVFSAAVYGHLRYYWPDFLSPAGVDLATSIGGVVSVSLGLWFELCFAKEIGISEKDRRRVSYLLMLFPIEIALMAFGQIRLALHINMIQVLMLPPIIFFIFWKSKRWSEEDLEPPLLPRMIVLCYHGAGTVAMVAAAISGLGLMNAHEISLYVATMHGVLSGGLMLLMLIYRNSVRSRREVELALQIDYSQRVIVAERAHKEEKDKMMSVLVHELTTPLSVIRMNIETSFEKVASKERIEHAINDMVRVIKRFSLAQKWEGDQIPVEAATFRIDEAIHEAVACSSAPDRIVAGEVCSGDVRTDRHILHLALSNLLENALRYGSSEAKVRVACRMIEEDDASHVEICVENEPGLAGWPDEDRVFGKFYRSGLAQRISGSGLGLHLSRDLMERAGGRMRYQPTPSAIRFVITLPECASHG